MTRGHLCPDVLWDSLLDEIFLFGNSVTDIPILNTHFRQPDLNQARTRCCHPGPHVGAINQGTRTLLGDSAAICN